MKGAIQRSAIVVVLLQLASCGDKEARRAADAEAGSGEEVKKAAERAGLSPAQRLLREAHYLTAWTDRDVTGKLRSDGRTLAVGIYRRGNDTQFTYRNPEEGGPVRIHSRLMDGRYDIYELVGGEAWRCTPGRLTESVGGTDFTHEDLMMPWMFWPGAELLGEERITGQKTWKIRVENPSPKGQYRFVQAWVHQKHGGLMQAVGYDAQGRPLKRFTVTDVQRVGSLGRGDYAIRRGRLDRLDPATNTWAGSSYIEFDRPSLVGAAE